MTSISPLIPRTEFPIFAAHPELVYLDSAATSQKPLAVLTAEQQFYATSNANVHRGIYVLAEQATEQYEAARSTVARFIGGEPDELVFTSGATASINLVAHSFVRPRLKRGTQIITTIAEHHSNFVPWQQLAKETGAKLTVVPLKRGGLSFSSRTQSDIGNPAIHGSPIRSGDKRLPVEDDIQEQPWQLDLEFLERALAERPTALVAVADVGNVLGTINPTAKITERAHAHGAPVLVDAAQSLAHRPIDVRVLGADFVVGSGHKVYGPTGIGFLWAKREHLAAMEPSSFGGEMIRSVTVEETTWNDVPWKFEAGTPNIAGAIGFAAALDWLSSIGCEPARGHLRSGSATGDHSSEVKENRPHWDVITTHEQSLLAHADAQLRSIDGLTILGPPNPRDRAGVIAFTLVQPEGFKGVQPSGLQHRLIHPHPASPQGYAGARALHPHDLASILDEQGVAIRAGHHCAQPLHHALGLPASTRASFGVYSSSEDIDRLIAGIHQAQRTFLH